MMRLLLLLLLLMSHHRLNQRRNCACTADSVGYPGSRIQAEMMTGIARALSRTADHTPLIDTWIIHHTSWVNVAKVDQFGWFLLIPVLLLINSVKTEFLLIELRKYLAKIH